MPLKKSNEKVKVEVGDIKKKNEMQSDPEANTVNVLRGFASLCDSETEESSKTCEMIKSVCSDGSEDKTFLTIFSTWDLPELNSYNVLNWFSFVINVAVSFLIGQFGFFGCTPLRIQNETFRVLLSPVSWSFYAWALVYTLEGFFVLVQLHSKSEMKKIVRSMKFWFTGACLAHSCYTVFFSLGKLWASTASSGVCWVCLSWIIVKHHISEKKNTLRKVFPSDVRHFITRWMDDLHFYFEHQHFTCQFIHWSAYPVSRYINFIGFTLHNIGMLAYYAKISEFYNTSDDCMGILWLIC